MQSFDHHSLKSVYPPKEMGFETYLFFLVQPQPLNAYLLKNVHWGMVLCILNLRSNFKPIFF